MKSLKNQNVLILGFARSGESASKLLLSLGANVFVYDDNFKTQILNEKKLKNINKENYKKIIKKNNHKIKINTNKNIFNWENYYLDKNLNTKKSFFKNFEKIKIIEHLNQIKNIKFNFCVISPSISLTHPAVLILSKTNTKIISELELGARYCKGKIFAITGTNGKTTTSSLLAEIFSNAGKQTFLCGNIGIPISSIALQTKKNSYIVCEVSSFQLETSNNFSPFASGFLNIQPDHLDRHKTLENYAIIKNKINQSPKTKKVFNFDDKIVKNFGENYFNAEFFSLKNKTNGAFFNQETNEIFYKNKKILNAENIKLLGKNNLSNILCAINLAKIGGVSNAKIKQACESFQPLEHRLEVVAKTPNIVFINDSKATNVESTIFALNAIENINFFNNKSEKPNLILLLGGSNKNLDFSPIFEKKIFSTIAFGEVIEKICLSAKNTNLITAKNFDNACEKAFEIASKNNKPHIILLSPASASFDEFSSFEMRGEKFKQNVFEFIKTNNL